MVVLLGAALAAFGVYYFFLRSHDPVVNMGADGRITAIDAGAAIVRLDGYQYQGIPQQLRDQATQLLGADPKVQAVVQNFDVQAIAQNRTPVGAVVAVAVTPEAMADASFRADLIAEAEDQLNANVEEVKLADKFAYSVELEAGVFPGMPSANLTFYFYENVLVEIITLDQVTGRTLTEQMLAASN